MEEVGRDLGNVDELVLKSLEVAVVLGGLHSSRYLSGVKYHRACGTRVAGVLLKLGEKALKVDVEQAVLLLLRIHNHILFHRQLNIGW